MNKSNSNRVQLEDISHMPNRIQNQIKKSNKKEDNYQIKRKDKSDRATIEMCLDPKTMYRLEKLINKGDLEYYEGCISTGKEANVYYGKGFENKHLAIKIYKTSVLVFKDRERYISGEFRFRHGYCKSNPRKMVAIWAEKEVRNLKRIQIAGIKAPSPLLLKSNLIIMELIGDNNNAAPRLKDAVVDDYERVYIEVVHIMKIMFKMCKLVHSDLSEYNLLYHNDLIYVIDVAQAVEDDHPNALSFLKRDCININNFFDKCGIEVITDKQLFDTITTFISTNKNKEISKDEIKEMIIKAREFNKEKELENERYFSLQNLAFENFEFPRTLNSMDELKIQGNQDIKNALSKMCGIIGIDENTDEKNIFEADSDEEEEEEDDDSSIEEIKIDDDHQIYFDKDGKIIDKPIESTENKTEEEKKGHKYDPFEGLSKKERQTKVKEENKLKRQNKKFTKYEKAKKVSKTSGKNK